MPARPGSLMGICLVGFNDLNNRGSRSRDNDNISRLRLGAFDGQLGVGAPYDHWNIERQSQFLGLIREDISQYRSRMMEFRQQIRANPKRFAKFNRPLHRIDIIPLGYGGLGMSTEIRRLG